MTQYPEGLDLRRRFDGFYLEVLSVKRDILNDALPTEPSEAVQSVRARLLKVLHDQEREITRLYTGEAERAYRDVRYAMVGLADEILLNTAWVGQQIWIDHLLEAALFQTQIAGSLIFDRIDALDDQVPDRLSSDLAEIYLLGLGLGFRGRYRSALSASPEGNDIDSEYEAAEKALHTARTKLAAHHFDKNPPTHYRVNLFPEAQLDEAPQDAVLKLPGIGRYIVVVALVLIVGLLLSALIWQFGVSPYEEIVVPGEAAAAEG